MSYLGFSPVQEPSGHISNDSSRGKSPVPSANRLRLAQDNGTAGKPPGSSQTTSITPAQQRADLTPSLPPFVLGMNHDEPMLRAASTRTPYRLALDRNQDHGLKSQRSRECQKSPHCGKCRLCHVHHSTTNPRLLSPPLQNLQSDHHQQHHCLRRSHP